jgi:RNA polymerase sporulation-specific sigma factor
MLNQIIEENKNLIYSIIKKYTYYYDKEDLFQTATIGLIKAYNNYDNSKNTKFSTYAYTYILSEVLLYINNNRDIRLGKNYLKIYKKINEAKLVLTQKLMKEPTTYELSLFLELDENLINQVLALTQSFSNLEEIISKDGKNLTLLDVVSDKDKDKMIDNLILKETLNNLTEEERQILMLRYYDERTQQEVANILGTNQVYISRNEKKVLKKLKEDLSKVA